MGRQESWQFSRPPVRRALDVIVIAHRNAETIDPCLESARKALAHIPDGGELIVVLNDASTSVREQTSDTGARVVETPANLGFAGGAMAGIDESGADWVALLNDDVVLDEDALQRLLATGRSAGDIGSVAPQIRFASFPNTLNSAGLSVDTLGIASERLLGVTIDEAGEESEIFGASGAATLYRRAMLDAVGGLDRSFFAYYEDADLAWRARMRGWRCRYQPAAVAYHLHSASFAHGSTRKWYLVGRNRVRMLAKNGSRQLLVRRGVPMVAYDIAYVGYVAVTARSLAPLRGRIRGLLEWTSFRRAGAAGRVPIRLDDAGGMRAALRRQRLYRQFSWGARRERPGSLGERDSDSAA
jgi:GT2 family glycosyltransferase